MSISSKFPEIIVKQDFVSPPLSYTLYFIYLFCPLSFSLDLHFEQASSGADGWLDG